MEVTIERILPGGLGLAHADGQTVMVALAAAGDRLRVRVERVKGSVAFASIEEIIEPSRDRIEPPCPYFGRCGGCDFQQMNYEAQLGAKKEIISDCLHRIAKIDAPDFEIVAAPNQWHYRSRAQWQYDAAQKHLGYFESGSRRVCDVAECAVLVPELQFTLGDLRAAMAGNSLAGDARYFRAIAGDDSALCTAGFERSHRPTAPWRPALEHPASSIEEEPREVTRTIAGETYHLGAESFFQTNVDLLPQLLEASIGHQHGATAIDLYCGVGLFTVPLARRFHDVVGVEDDTDATAFARQNLVHANLSNAGVERSDVGNWLASNEHNPRFASLDFLLLDPPRTGAESRVVAGILQLRPKRICYVSCDPATLARDLRKIIASGYSLDSILAFDMFPQTHHVETVVHLSSS